MYVFTWLAGWLAGWTGERGLCDPSALLEGREGIRSEVRFFSCFLGRGKNGKDGKEGKEGRVD